MVAIVSGTSLGLELTSLGTLGERGTFGQAALGQTGERSYVNVANGNLVIQDRDDYVASRGPDIDVMRTYNSQGLADDDNIDNWALGIYKKQLTYTGTLNAAGSTVSREGQDGSVATYNWDVPSQSYITTAGGGAFDTIKYDGTAFTWTDGTTGSGETYAKTNAGEARLASVTDNRGNTSTYQYNAATAPNGANLVSGVTDASGEQIQYGYTGNNLTSVKHVDTANVAKSHVTYVYDGKNRLQTVKVDLTPADGSISDNNFYSTTYTYETINNKRVASITQKDNTTVSFTYDASGRVSKVTDGLLKATTFTYVANKTTVTDALGNKTAYEYDANGQLTKVTAPAVGGVSQVTQFAYTNGDLTSMTDPMGQVTTMQYSNGNQTLLTDPAGNTVKRTFDTRNQLLTETVSPQSGTSLVTRYIYDGTARNQLRYAVSAEGRVTEYQYRAAGFGQQTDKLEYYAAAFDVSAYGTTFDATAAVPDTVGQLAALDSWHTGKALYLTNTTYDPVRGQVQNVTRWNAVDANGVGIVDGKQSTTVYTRDYNGALLGVITPNGDQTSFLVDGLERVTQATDPYGVVTTTLYDDTNKTIKLTQVNGLVNSTIYDKTGRVITVTQVSGANTLGTTTYAYDADGQLLMTEDATGARNYRLYDAAGRKVADVDATGTLTEYVYNKDNLVTHATTYSTAVALSALGITGAPLNPALSMIRPAKLALDLQSWNVYDGANRLVRSVDGRGGVTEIAYDGASRIVSTTRRATTVATANLATLGDAPTLTDVTVGSNPADDRMLRNFYDSDGLLRGVLDAEGYLTEHRYNGDGQCVQSLRYWRPTDVAQRASGTLASLIPQSDTDHDAVTTYLYDTKGNQVGVVDAEGFLTETEYDLNGNVTKSVRHAKNAVGPVLITSKLADVLPANDIDAQTKLRSYDKFNRVLTETDAQNTVTTYSYDNVGNLTKTERASNDTSDKRTTLARYDAQGRVIAELSAEGVLAIANAELPATSWAGWGISYTYDKAGHRISMTDAIGNKTLYYYDADGHLTHTINALGEVTRNQYNDLGQLKAVLKYDTRLTSAVLATLNGGLNTGVPTLSGTSSAVTYDYDAGGALANVTDALGFKRNYAYNAFSEAWKVTNAFGTADAVLTTTTYDQRGFAYDTKADDGGLNTVTRTEYDAFGRLTKVTDPMQGVRQYLFDRLGRQVETDDTLGAAHKTTYDAFDRVLDRTDALGKKTTYQYDLAARSVTVTTPEGIAITTGFNRLGQTVSVSDARNAFDKTTYTYDRDGNLKQTTGPDGAVLSRTTYDHADRVTDSYDGMNNRVTIAYDAANRVATRTVDPDSTGYIGLKLITKYGWDAQGRQITTTDPDGIVTQLDYNVAGQLIKKTVDPSTASPNYTGLNLATTYTYDGRGNTLIVMSPNANMFKAANSLPATWDTMRTKYTYDKLDRRVKQEVQDLSDPATPTSAAVVLTMRTWDYDANGNVTRAIDGNLNATYFAYDHENRLNYSIDATGAVTGTTYNAEGRVYETTWFAQAISLTGLAVSPTIDAITALITPTNDDAATRNIYDRDGRMTVTVNRRGHVVGYQYDAAGNVIERRAYASAITSEAQLSPFAPTVDDARDAITRTVYDKYNRAVFTIDGIGAVVQQSYDIDGRVTERRAYAATVATSTTVTAAALGTATAAIADDAHDERVRNAYDKTGRLSLIADGAGAVTQRTYDPSGNVTKLTQFATAIGASGNVVAPTSTSADRTTLITYDGANRVVYTRDAVGAVVRNSYDANGNVTQRYSYYTAIGLAVAGTSAGIGGAVRGNTSDRVETSAYDAADRLQYAMDGAGGITEYKYDAEGNRLQTTRYFKAGSKAGLGTNPGRALMKQAIALSAQDRKDYRAYDADGRLKYTVDGMGYITELVYDTLGRVTDSILYNQKLPIGAVTTGAALRQAIQFGISPTAPKRADHFTYDSAGRKTSATDAMGFAESYQYDALGRKTKFTNKKGDSWDYDYDAAGNLKKETSPLVDHASFEGGMMVVRSERLETTYSYDALANLKSRSEAANVPADIRTTAYEYDAAGRQTRTVFPPVDVYDSADNVATNGASGLAARAKITRTLDTVVKYDVFGNAISSKDTADKYSYKAYDAAGNIYYETDAAGFVTGYQVNAFGEAWQVTRYPSSFTTITDATSKLLMDRGALAAAAASNAGSIRVLKKDFDGAGRVVTVTEPSTNAYDADTGTTYAPASRVTTYTYNGFGELVFTSDGKSAMSYFYDDRGLQKATVDALGFVTTQTFDEAGAVLDRVEWATNLAAGSWNSAAAFLPATTASNDDRKTTSVYNKVGNKLSETRVGVKVTANTVITNHSDYQLNVGGVTAAPTVNITANAAGVPFVSGYAFAGVADGSAVLQWSATPAGQNSSVQMRQVTTAGTADWTDVSTAITKEGGIERFYIASDTPAGDYQFEVRIESNGATVQRTMATVHIAARAGGAVTLSPAIQGLAQVQNVGGVDQFQWATPTDTNTSAVVHFKRPDSTEWESAPVYTAGGIQYVPIPSDMPAGTYQVQLDFKRFATAAANLVTNYDYDALGNVITMTDAAGTVSRTYYDVLGRVVGTISPTGNAGTLETDYWRDANGNAIYQLQRAQGDASTDRTQASTFDSFGHVVQRMDALGQMKYFSYDARGNIAKTWFEVASGNGTATIYQRYDYDNLGRVITITEPAPATIAGTTSGSTVTRMTYNAFGEMTGRGVDGITGGEYWNYNNAGRVWRTNEGDGADRGVLYDVQGRATVEVRNSGLAADIDVTTFSNEDALRASVGGRRTITRYDAMGRVLEQKLPARLEQEGGVSVNHMTSSAAIVQVGVLVVDQNNSGWTPGIPTWTQSNKVQLGWSGLGALGSGDVMVTLRYTTAPVHLTYQVYEAGEPVTRAIDYPAKTLTLTRTLSAAEAASGALLDWVEPSAAQAGAIAQVLGVTVSKQDLYGNWQVMLDQNAFGDGANSITVASPPNPGATVVLQVRRVGDTTWTNKTMANFGDRQYVDATSLGVGVFEYQVLVTLPGASSSTLTASGVLDLKLPPVAVIGLAISGNSAGIYSWQSPTDPTLTQTLRYRVASSTDAWRTLPVTTIAANTSGVDTSALAAGTYDYELVQSTSGELRALAHAMGQMVITAAQGVPAVGGARFVGNADGTSTVSWTAPAAGTTPLLQFRLVGAGSWTTVTPAAPVNGVQAGAIVQQAQGNYEIQLLMQQVATTVAKSKYTFVMPAATAGAPTFALTTFGQGLPIVADVGFEPAVNGDWAMTWPKPTGMNAKFEWRLAGTSTWVDKTPAGGFSTYMLAGVTRQRISYLANDLPSGNHEVRVTYTSTATPTTTLNCSAGVISTYAAQNIPSTVQVTTPTVPATNLPVINATTIGNADGSWTIQWPKPAADKVAGAGYRRPGTTTYATNVVITEPVPGTQQILIPANTLGAGQWEVAVFYATTGTSTVWTDQYTFNVNLTSSSQTAAALTTTTTVVPYVPGIGWVANPGGGSTFTWNKPAAPLTSTIRARQHVGGTIWYNGAVEDLGNGQMRYVVNTLGPGDWDIEVFITDTAAATTARSTAVLTVTGTTHTIVDTTVYAIQPTFVSSATDGSWSLEWQTPPVGTTTTLNYRAVGTTQWFALPGTPSDLGATKKLSLSATTIPNGNYELDLFNTSGSGVRTGQFNGTVVQSFVAPTRPTFVNTTPPYTPGISQIPATFTANSDGSWRLTWPTSTVSGATLKLQFQKPDGTWIDNPYTVQISGANSYIDVPDNLATGVTKVDLAYMQGATTTRISQYTANVTTPEDGVQAVLTGTTNMGATWQANADGTYVISWPAAPAGTNPKLAYRIKGTTAWTQVAMSPTQVQYTGPAATAGTLEYDVRYETPAGVRTSQALVEVTATTKPGQPVGTGANDPYTPKQYSGSQNASPGTSVLYTFTLTAEPVALTGLSFTTNAGGGSTLSWTKPVSATTATVRYRVVNTTTWSDIATVTAGTTQSVTFPPEVPPGQYELDIASLNGATVVGSMGGRLAVPGITEITNLVSANPALNLQPVVTHKVDRWGNVLEANDPRSGSWITKYFYNANNQVVEQWQPDAAGSTGSTSPVTKIYYDALGRQIAVSDANGNRAEQYWDAGGHLVKEVHADDGQVTYSYDVFGDRTQSVTQLNSLQSAMTDFKFDKLSRLVETDSAAVDVRSMSTGWVLSGANMQRIVETTTWDAAGRKTSTVNGANETTTYKNDLRGNVIETTHGGVTTDYAYDAMGRQVKMKDANVGLPATLQRPVVYAATWTYDYFGQLQGHTDLGGATYSYTYDAARQLVAQSNDRAGAQKVDASYAYDIAGQAVRIEDKTLGKVTTYTYDLAGHHVRERVEQKTTLSSGAVLPVVYQDNFIAYDTLGRMTWARDGRTEVMVSYDLAGNRSHVSTSVINGNTAEQATDKYYSYDAMNRQVLADIGADYKLGDKGHRIVYDKAGNKVSDSWIGNVVQTIAGGQVTFGYYQGMDNYSTGTMTLPNTYKTQQGLTTEVYARDALGRITTITRDGVVVDNRYYDAASREVQTGVESLDPAYLTALNGTNSRGAVLNGNGTELRKTQFDGSGRAAAQNVSSNGTLKYNLWYNKLDNSALNVDAAGNVLGYRMDDAGGHSTDYKNTYIALETYEQSQIDANRDNITGTTKNAYDANGNLVAVDDVKQDANDRSFVNDSAGKVLYVNQGGHIQRQTIVNGEVLGRYGDAVNDAEARNNQGVPVFKGVADFDFGFKASGGNTPNVPAMSHVVGAGDTMEGLAQSFYGDSRLWYRIADANGLSSNSDLRPGQVIKIPGSQSSANASDTFTPYDPSKVIGDQMPFVPQPPKKSNLFAQLLLTIIVVIVAAMTQQWYLTNLAAPTSVAFGVVDTAVAGISSAATVTTGGMTLGFGAADAAIGGALGGAAGSIAGQAAGMALGVQNSFNWKNVGLAAISGGVAGGMGGTSPLGGAPTDIGNVVARAAIGNALTQGLGIAAGLQHSFDWHGVVASAVGAGVGAAVAPELGNSFGGRLTTGLIAGTAAAVMHGGKISVLQVATDAFGNALGESVASMTSEPAFSGGETWAADLAARKVAKDPLGLRQYADDIAGTFRAAKALFGGTSEDTGSSRVVTDSSTNAEMLASDMAAKGIDWDLTPMGGNVRVSPGGGGRTATVNGVSVNEKASRTFQAAGDLAGMGELYRDYGLLSPLMGELQQQTTLENLKGAVQKKLGLMRILPSPGELGASQVTRPDGSIGYSNADLIDRYGDVLRKVEMWKQGIIELDTRSMLITSIGTAKLSPADWVAENTRRYANAFAIGLDEGQRGYDAGTLRYPQDMPGQLQVGSFADNAARVAVIAYNKSIGVPEGAGQLLSMNRWSYDPSGSGAYNRIDLLMDLGPSRNNGALILRTAIEGKSTLAAVQSSSAQLQRVYEWNTPNIITVTRQGAVPWAPTQPKRLR